MTKIFLFFFASCLLIKDSLANSTASDSILDAASSFRSHSQLWTDETEYLIGVQRADKLKKFGTKGHVNFELRKNSIPSLVVLEQLDPIRRLEWALRSADASSDFVRPDDLKFLKSDSRVKSILSLVTEGDLLKVFSGRLDPSQFHSKCQKLLGNLDLKIRESLLTDSLFSWCLEQKDRAFNREFLGFSPETDSRIFALVFIQRALDSAALLDRWEYFARARYVLNSDPLIRSKNLRKFDDFLQTVWSLRDYKRVNPNEIEKFFSATKDDSLFDHKLIFLENWFLEAQNQNDLKRSAEFLGNFVKHSRDKGRKVPLWKYEALLKLNIELRELEKAFESLEYFEAELFDNRSVFDSGTFNFFSVKADYFRAKALKLLSSSQSEPRRSDTLSWSEHYFRRALNSGALDSVLRDAILREYSELLESLGFWVEASESWHVLFRLGLSPEARKQGLFKAASVLAWNLKTGMEIQESRRILLKLGSLSSFFVRLYPYSTEAKEIARRFRFESKKHNFRKDPVIQATLFEVESLSDPMFLKKQRKEN